MKKRFFIILLSLLVLLPACSLHRTSMKEPVSFYYRLKEYRYNSDSPVIVSEQREASGHQQDLHYLLSLYLIGPVDEALISPFPKGTKLLGISYDNSSLILELSDTSRNLNSPGFSLACACISKTCMALTDAESVTVVSGSRTLTTAESDLLLTDEPFSEMQETGG